MKGVMGCLGVTARICAVAFALVLALSLPFSLGAHDLGQVLFTPATLSDLIVTRVVDSGLLRRLVRERMLSGELFGQGADQGFDFRQAVSHLDPAEVDAVLEILLPPSWVGDQITTAFGSAYAWLDNDQVLPNLVIDIRPLKEGLLTGGAGRLVEIIVDSWPACTVDQANQMDQAMATTGEAPILYCEPPEPYRSGLTQVATANIVGLVGGMPDRIPLARELAPGAGADPAQVMAFKERIRMARALAQWGWILPLSLLGVIMALVVRSWRSLSRWWGVPVLAGGLLSFLLLLVGGSLARQALATIVPSGQIPEAAGSLVQLVGGGLLNEIARRLFWQSLLLTLGAVVLFASGFLIGRRKPAPEVPPAPTVSITGVGPSPSSTPRPLEPTPGSPSDRRGGDKPSGMFG
jgi:hypothetical protein